LFGVADKPTVHHCTPPRNLAKNGFSKKLFSKNIFLKLFSKKLYLFVLPKNDFSKKAFLGKHFFEAFL
jgi:hypothetical protein